MAKKLKKPTVVTLTHTGDRNVMTLSNGIRVVNFNITKDIIFEDGTILKGVSKEAAEKILLDKKEITYSVDAFKAAKNVLVNYEITPELEEEVIELMEFDGFVIMNPMTLRAVTNYMLHESGEDPKIEDFVSMPFRQVHIVDKKEKKCSKDIFMLSNILSEVI